MTETAAYKKMYKWLVNSDCFPFLLQNDELAKRLLEDARVKYPQAAIYTCGVVAYICLTEQARFFLLKEQQAKQENLKQELKETKQIIKTLTAGKSSPS